MSCMKRSVLILFGLPGLLLVGTFLYWGILLLFFGYELTTSEGAVERLAEKAIAERNPAICNKVIHPQIMMGPARYEFVNGCKYEYAFVTGDTSICMNTMSPDNCVMRIAQDRNSPELCAMAIDPRRQGTDGRGSCFGYFAGREKDYEYCERLFPLSDIPESQHKICISDYIGFDKSKIHLSLCDTITNPDLEEFCMARVNNSL